jgi:hypothetical protein
MDDALDVVQHGAQSSSATAVNKLAVRRAAGSDRLAELVRWEQDLASEQRCWTRRSSRPSPERGRNTTLRPNSAAATGWPRFSAERATLQKTFASEFLG